MKVWDFRCHARCDNRYTSGDSLHQTIWDMEEAGWFVALTPEWRFEKLFCPDHTTFTFGETWAVECSDCDYYEEFDTEEEAADEASEHNRLDCCDHHWHSAEVLSPVEQEERAERWRIQREESDRRALERKYHERYVAFLIDQDQNRRREDMQESFERPSGVAHKVTAMAIIAVAVLGVILLLAGCSKYTEQFKDAPRSKVSNTKEADTITFPDGFSNVATKCDHGNRVYVLFHEDNAFGGISVVPNAKGC